MRRIGAALALALGFLAPAQALARIEANTAFAPAVIAAGAAARASVIVQNSDTAPGTGLNFSLPLPEGMLIHGTGRLSSDCGAPASLTETGGRVTVALSGGLLPAASGATPGSCSVSFDVTGARVSTFLMEIPVAAVRAQVSGAAQENGARAQSSLSVTMAPITVAVSSPVSASAKTAQVIQRSYRFTNSNGVAVTGMGLDIDMSVIGSNWRALGSPIANSCGGSFSITPLPPLGSNNDEATLVRLAGASIPAKDNCTLTFNVTPARKPGSPYLQLGQSQQLPAGIMVSDQGVSNALSNDHWVSFRGGAIGEMRVDGKTATTIDVISGEQIDVTFRTLNYTARAFPGVSIPIRVPAAIEILSMSSSCGGGLVHTSSGATWTFDHPAAPLEPTTNWQGAECVATLRVRAKSAGSHTVSVTGAVFSGTYISGQSAVITASMSPVSGTGWFDRSTVLTPDSSIFRIRLTNKSSSVPVEGITIANPVATRIAGAIIGPRGVVENDCAGASPVIAPDRSRIDLSGIDLPAGGSCVVGYQVTFGSGSLDTTSSDGITKTNTIGPADITYRDGSGNAAPWNAAINADILLKTSVVVNGSIAPNPSAEGSRARLTMQVERANAEGHGLRDIGFNLALESGITIDAAPEFSSNCGGSLVSTPGSATFRVEGGQMPFTAGQVSGSCRFEAFVRLPILNQGENNRLISSPIYSDSAANTRRTFWAQDQNVNGDAGHVANHWGKSVVIEVGKYNLGLGLEFGDASVGRSGTTRMIISFSNEANTNLALTGVRLAVDLGGTGVNLAAVPDPVYRVKSGAAGACTGARFEPLANGMRLVDANIDKGAVCQFQFSVTAATSGNRIISIPANAVASNERVTNPAGASATLTVASLLSAAMGFEPNLVAEGGLANLVVEIVNTMADDYHGAEPAASLALPAWILVAGAPATTCSGASVVLSGSSLNLSGGVFRSGSSCRFSVPVRISASAAYEIRLPAGTISTMEGVTNTAELAATIRVLRPPVLTLATPSAMTGTGRVGTATIRLQNPNAISLNPEGFSGLALAVTPSPLMEFVNPAVESTCAGLASAATGSGGLALSRISLPAGQGCLVTLAARSASPGLHGSQAGGITVQEAALPAAPALDIPWRMVADPTIGIAVAGAPPDSEIPFRLGVEIFNSNEVAIGMGAPGLSIDLPRIPAVMTVASGPATLSGCGPASLAAAPGSGALTISNGTLPPGGTCRIELSLVTPGGGDHVLRPSPLVLQYGAVAVDPLTISVLSSHADLRISRNIRVLGRDIGEIGACARLEDPGADLLHILPGACIEVRVRIENPASESKIARDIRASETIAGNFDLASVEKESFDRVTPGAGLLAAEIAAIAPGEVKTFSYRAVLR